MPHDLRLSFPPSATPPPLGEERELLLLGARELRVSPAILAAVRTVRVSFDARPRHRVWRVLLRAWTRAEEAPAEPPTTPPTFAEPGPGAPHVAIVGSGPAGLFCALDLAAAGVRVTVVERGRDVRRRRRAIRALHRGLPADPDSNYCFGEGGAGTYSDGKLHTRSGRKRDVRAVLEVLVAHGAPREILTSWRPHVGSNRLPAVVEAIRETILRSGGAVRFGTRAERIEVAAGPEGASRFAALHVRELDGGGTERLAADACVLATGHSALDAVRMAREAGARLEPKGFAMGVRAEHRQRWLDRQQYGGLRGTCDLPASAYELSTTVDGRGVYSFCMCPGGFVVPATTAPDRVVVNGMSLSRRDSPYANAGVVVAIEPEDWCAGRGEAWGWPELLARAGGPAELPRRPEDDPLFGVRLQHALEAVAARLGGGENRAPAQRLDRLVEGGGADAPVLPTSYRPGVTGARLDEHLPAGLVLRLRRAAADFDRHLPGFVSESGQVLGVESRTSSPVRIGRDPGTLEARGVAGLYPCGEGAGYAGGIVSAALDGRRVADAVATRCQGPATARPRPAH